MASPCDYLKAPPYIGIDTPASLACKAAQGQAGKVDDALVKDQTVALSQLIKEAGFTGRDALIMRAIVFAESGADPSAKNPAPCSDKGDHAVGLAQVCTPMHMSEKDALDPRKNLAKSYDLYIGRGKKFTDWATYNDGAYRGHLGKDARIKVDSRSLTSEVLDAGGGIVDKALGPLDELAAAFLSPDFYARLGKGGLGIIFVVVGVGALALIALQPVARTASKVTATGKLASKIGRPIG